VDLIFQPSFLDDLILLLLVFVKVTIDETSSFSSFFFVVMFRFPSFRFVLVIVGFNFSVCSFWILKAKEVLTNEIVTPSFLSIFFPQKQKIDLLQLSKMKKSEKMKKMKKKKKKKQDLITGPSIEKDYQ